MYSHLCSHSALYTCMRLADNWYFPIFRSCSYWLYRILSMLVLHSHLPILTSRIPMLLPAKLPKRFWLNWEPSHLPSLMHVGYLWGLDQESLAWHNRYCWCLLYMYCLMEVAFVLFTRHYMYYLACSHCSVFLDMYVTVRASCLYCTDIHVHVHVQSYTYKCSMCRVYEKHWPNHTVVCTFCACPTP